MVPVAVDIAPGDNAISHFLQVVPADDLDGDGLPNDWEVENGSNPFTNDANQDLDFDTQTTLEEYIAGTDIGDSNSFFRIESIDPMAPVAVSFQSVTGRLYAVDYTENIQAMPQVWTELTNSVLGTGAPVAVEDQDFATNRHYRIRVRLVPAPP